MRLPTRAILIEGSSVEIFPSVDRLVSYVESIDVSNNLYECFTTDGKEIRLIVVASGQWLAKHETVKSELVEAPDKQNQFKKVLGDCLRQRGISVPNSATLDEIAALIPPSFVEK